MTCCCTFLLVVFGTTLYMPLMNGDKNARKLFCALLLIPLSLLLGNIVIQSTSASTGHHQKLAEALSLTLLVVYMNVLGRRLRKSPVAMEGCPRNGTSKMSVALASLLVILAVTGGVLFFKDNLALCIGAEPPARRPTESVAFGSSVLGVPRDFLNLFSTRDYSMHGGMLPWRLIAYADASKPIGDKKLPQSRDEWIDAFEHNVDVNMELSDDWLSMHGQCVKDMPSVVSDRSPDETWMAYKDNVLYRLKLYNGDGKCNVLLEAFDLALAQQALHRRFVGEDESWPRHGKPSLREKR